jgi:hypothetical protein
MKHIPLLCILFICFTACTSSKRSTGPSITSTDVIKGLDLSALMANGLKPVDAETADIIHDNYTNKFKGKIERNWISTNQNVLPRSGQQSNHVWISYEEFSAFVNSLENIKTAMKKNNNLDVSGVRIYFAAYPKGKEYQPSEKKITIVLCGTYAKETPKGIAHTDIVGENKNKGNKRELAAYHNHGHLCPPEQCEGALLDKE